MQTKRIDLVIIVIVLLSACNPPKNAQSPTRITSQAEKAAQGELLSPKIASPSPILELMPTRRPTFTPKPTRMATPTLIPPTSTPTPDLTIYNFDALSDPRNLDSFIMTSHTTTTGSGLTEEQLSTFEYTKQPLSMHHRGKYVSTGNTSVSDGFTVIDKGWVFQISSGGWSGQPIGDSDPIHLADIRANAGIVYFVRGSYAGQEDYKGIPVYHFTFDQGDLANNLGKMQVEKAQADLYVAVKGYYPVHFSARLTGKVVFSPGKGFLEGVMDITKDLTAINQPLNNNPPSIDPNFKLDPGVPLPEKTQLQNVGYSLSSGASYLYQTSIKLADFFTFYKNLPPTNGWSVVKVGPMTEPVRCNDCVILTNGELQVTVTWGDRFTNYVILLDFPPE